MKTVIITLIIFLTLGAEAQIRKAELVANGLTCSMCSFATQKQLKTINFIDSIANDLDHTSYVLYFKKDAKVDLSLIKKKVEDAGFSVGSLIVTMQFDQVKVENNYHYSLNNTLYHFMNIKPQTLNGDVRVKVVDKGFVSDKEFKKYKKMAEKYPCYETGKMPDVERVYHLTLI